MSESRLASIMHSHTEDEYGECEWCGHSWPCDPAELATEVARLRAELAAAAEREQALSARLGRMENLLGEYMDALAAAQRRYRDMAEDYHTAMADLDGPEGDAR